MTTRISRRALLRAGGGATLAALLAACTDGTDGTESVQDRGAADGSAGDEQLTIIVPTFEVLVGESPTIPMGIIGGDQRPILDAEPVVTVLLDDAVVAEDVRPVFFGEGLGDRGVYVMQPAVTDPGVHDVVVDVPGRGRGTGVFSAVTPDNAQVVGAPGTDFPSLATPTTEDPGPLERLCTQDPPCDMHATSLDEAMAAGPVVFSVATPAFCQTAVCGPVVSVVQGVRDDLGRDDVTFVHVEVFTDAGNTATPTVEELALPTEPWTWLIDARGTVTDRFDGPVVPDLLAEAVRRL